jgi:F-type H+-transporting ATPase subunit delta
MPKAASARRYAQAVFQIGLEHDNLEQWYDDLATMAAALDDGELAAFLNAPQVTVDRKVEVISEALGDSVSPLAANLLALLASRGIASILPDLVESYQALLDDHRGIERAEVVSPVPLDDEQRRRVSDLLVGMVGKQVRLNSRVEPSILGGFVARVGDRVIDGSARTRLNQMRRRLVGQ